MSNLFVEIDGRIVSKSKSGGINVGLGMMLAGLGALFQGLGNNSAQKYEKCKKWIKKSRIDEITFEENLIALKSGDDDDNGNPPMVFRNVEGVEVEQPEVERKEEPEFAPAGWWILVGTVRCHVADPEVAKQIVNEPDESKVAMAIQRLADEIAFKPVNQYGSLFEKASEHFETTSKDL